MVPDQKQVAMACLGCHTAISADLASGLCLHCLSLRFHSVIEAREDPDFPRETLPRGFDYIDTLGRGGMGVVCLAYQRQLGRYVALKKLLCLSRQHPKALDRFKQEARAAACLSHPGIVPVWEVSEEGDSAWYAMEYIDGGDLSQALARRGGSFDWREAVELSAQIADAIQCAHMAGVVHRDLKPSNVLLTSEGVPKVADFGLAWVFGQEARELTATGEILGTPAYLAPESISGTKREGDARPVDIYALGALLFHLIAGRPPFVGDHPMQILGAIANETAPRLTDVANDKAVPWDVAQVCARCLEKNPSNRFSSARELKETLRGCTEKRRGSRFVSRLKYQKKHVAFYSLLSIILFTSILFVASKGIFTSFHISAPLRPMLVAVMPFVSSSKDESAVLLAGGLQEELISALNRLTDLRVIAGSSARTAERSLEDPRALRKILGAEVVLSATIQKWQDTLRVNARLTNTNDGTTLWSGAYDRHETNLLNLQTDLAIDIASRLSVRISEHAAEFTLGTFSEIPEAGRLLVRARELCSDASSSVDQLDQAEKFLVRATQLDPAYALAFAYLSELHTRKYHWGNDRSEPRLALGLQAVQQALRLNPNLPEAHTALGNYYYRGSRDYATARPHFERALALAPNSIVALESLAQMLRRQGEFRIASVNFKKAMELDPLNAILAYNTADTFLRLRDYEISSQILEAALVRMPKQVALVKLRGDLQVLWKGDLGAMREDILHRNSAQPTPQFYLRDKINWLILEHRIDEALNALRGSNLVILEGQSIYLTREGYEAWLLYLKGGSIDAARVLAQKALEPISRELQRSPNDARVLLHAAEVQAVLGNIQEAERLGRRTLTEGDLACADAFDRGYFQRSLAILFASAGEDAKALALLRKLLEEPNQSSVHYLRLHPALNRFAQKFM